MMMARYFLLCLLILKLSFAEGQNAKWTLGVKPGIGLSGIRHTDHLDRLTSDEYKQGLNFSGGIRVGYRFSNYLSMTLDGEWERIEDRRVRIARNENVVTETGTANFTVIFEYRNRFNRIQTPLSVHFFPFPDKVNGYLIGGIMPTLILNGEIKGTYKTAVPDAVFLVENKKADFNIPYNKDQKKDLIYQAGLGFAFSKRFSAELVYRFNRPIRYMLYNPGYSMIGVPIYKIRANQGLQLSILAKLKK